MGIVKLPKMAESEIKKPILDANSCRIAFIYGNFPYICPFQYVYLNDAFYFCFTDYGKKQKFYLNITFIIKLGLELFN